MPPSSVTALKISTIHNPFADGAVKLRLGVGAGCERRTTAMPRDVDEDPVLHALQPSAGMLGPLERV